MFTARFRRVWSNIEPKLLPKRHRATGRALIASLYGNGGMPKRKSPENQERNLCLQSSRLIAFNRDDAPKTPRERLRLMRYRRARMPAICLAWLIAFSTTANSAADANRSALPAGWHLIRTKNPNGGPDAVSVSHTADVIRSDLDFAGVMLRCGEKDIEVIVVAVTPFSPRAKPEVTVRVDAKEWRFSAQVIPPGAEFQLPVEAGRL